MILLNGLKVEFEVFPNGETKVVQESIIKNLRPKKNTLSFKYENDGDLIRLMFVKRFLELKLDKTASIDLIIYYMPYSRMDRSENDSVFTLKYVTDIINSLNFDSVLVIEAHSDVTPALLNNSKSYLVNEQLLTYTIDDVGFDLEKDYIVYPDAGAQKRYAKSLKGNALIGHKNRDFDTGEIVSFDLVGESEPGNRAIIVDDLCSYGGTFIATAEKLKERGFKEIYLLVAHAEYSIFKGKIFEEGSPIDKVFTTNSILSEHLSVHELSENRIKIFEMEKLVKHL